jgi:hypothetical protein
MKVWIGIIIVLVLIVIIVIGIAMVRGKSKQQQTIHAMRMGQPPTEEHLQARLQNYNKLSDEDKYKILDLLGPTQEL